MPPSVDSAAVSASEVVVVVTTQTVDKSVVSLVVDTEGVTAVAWLTACCSVT